MKFTPEVIQAIKQIKLMFPDSKLTIHFATAEQIKQIKEVGLKGVSKMQKK